MRKRFILSDSSENSYGYHVLSEGIDLTRFKANPVMFYNHDRFNMPIGRWENIAVEDGKLQADAVFDKKDELGATVAQKVADGFLNATSIGFKALAVEIRDEALGESDKVRKKMYVTKSELMEVSIVDIPANRNAVKIDLSAIHDESVLNYLAHTEDFISKSYQNQNFKTLNSEEKDKEKKVNAIVDFLSNLFSSPKEQPKADNKAEVVSIELSPQFQELFDKLTTISAKLEAQEAAFLALQAEKEEWRRKAQEYGEKPADTHTPQAKTINTGFGELPESTLAMLDTLEHNKTADQYLSILQ